MNYPTPQKEAIDTIEQITPWYAGATTEEGIVQMIAPNGDIAAIVTPNGVVMTFGEYAETYMEKSMLWGRRN